MFFLFFQLISLHIIGIDLGTTFSVAAVYRNNNVEIIPDESDQNTIPSVVSYYKGDRVVGDSALKLKTIIPEETIFAVKRIIGRRFSDESVQQELKRVPYHIVDIDDRPFIKIFQSDDDDLIVSPEEISALILTKLKLQCEKYLKEPITDAVITVPAYFNEEQRKATLIAGEISGLKVRRIISEPTAAALAYGLAQKGDKYVIVYDLGGGTFDVSLLAMENGYFEVIATGGDTRLGGEDFDDRCVHEMLQRFYSQTNRDVSHDKVSISRLKKSCEKAKIELSTKNETIINIPLFIDDIDLKEVFTREQFDSHNIDLYNKTLEIIDKVLQDGEITKNEINDIVMIGGSTRIPTIREIVSNHFDGKELCLSINPDEAVAYGAAIQASIIDNMSTDLVIIDVYPLTLGVETVGGLMSPIIRRNTRIPVKRSKLFTTFNDDSAGARIEIFEGERKFTRDNRVLGVFELHKLPRAPRGTLQIEVIFEIDANAILTVTAKELSTMNSESIQIDTLEFTLSQMEIEDAIESANLFKEEDEKDVKRVKARIEYEGEILDALRNIKNEKEKEKENYKEMKKKLKERQKWIEENPMEAPEIYKKKCEELRSELAMMFRVKQIAGNEL
ncbi:luminal-binding protein 5 [Histomonas meleagridis]|uniref:luminal-binding protein 5 n=1 Tax=Histomonas meleagridis TaxID=135588 RepID=UPI0035597F41|nr:luminal-binding protein 5 [Histomonas meleagridis]KAH0803490.1 luminal-binding protein 5 [Histomonas meleagridis]